MGNSPSFEGALPRLLAWSKTRLGKVSARVEDAKLQQQEDVDSVPLAAGRATVSEFLRERERYLNFGASRYLLCYPRSDGCDLLQCILQLERWRHEAIVFRQGQRRFEDLTLFQVACWAGKAALVEKYLRAGVPANQPIEAGEFAGCSPLHLALMAACGDCARLATVRALLRYGADVGHRNGSGNTPLHLLLSLDGPIDMQLLRLMTSNGSDENATNDRGETPFELMLASHNLSEIEIYIEGGGTINLFNSVNKRGCLAIMLVDHRMSAEYFADLSNFVRVDEHGRNASHNVVSVEDRVGDAGYIEFVQFKLPMLLQSFLNAGSDIDCKDNSGKTLLHYAVDLHNKRIVSLLLKFGSDINATDANGNSALAASLDFSKLRITGQQMKQNNMITDILVVHVRNLELKGGFVSKYSKSQIVRARKLNETRN